MVSLAGAAQGLRNLFAGVVGGDIAQNPQLFTRTFAKGLALAIWVEDVSGPPLPNARVQVIVQQQPPGGSTWTNLITLSGVTGVNGLVNIVDVNGQYDLTQSYQVAITVTSPAGAITKLTGTLWPGQSSPNGTIAGSWGRGFALTVSATYATITAGSQPSPAGGPAPLTVGFFTRPPAGYEGTGAYAWWYWQAPPPGPVPISFPVLFAQAPNASGIFQVGVYIVWATFTDDAGHVSQSNGIPVIVS
jgi:hypothetical protein